MVKWNKLLLITASAGLLAACGNGETEDTGEEPTEETDTAEEADTTTGATQVAVSDEESLLEGVSSDGAWILLFQDDVSSEEELVLEGGFENNAGETERKLALYDQDDEGEVENLYTLTAPSITIQNDSTRLQYGIFEGDVYVEADTFRLVDGTIDGDLIFSSEEFEETAEIEGTITGETRVEE